MKNQGIYHQIKECSTSPLPCCKLKRNVKTYALDKVIIHNNLANLYIAQNRFSKAIPHLKTVVDKRPNDKRALSLLHIAEVLQQAVTP